MIPIGAIEDPEPREVVGPKLLVPDNGETTRSLVSPILLRMPCTNPPPAMLAVGGTSSTSFAEMTVDDRRLVTSANFRRELTDEFDTLGGDRKRRKLGRTGCQKRHEIK